MALCQQQLKEQRICLDRGKLPLLSDSLIAGQAVTGAKDATP